MFVSFILVVVGENVLTYVPSYSMANSFYHSVVRVWSMVGDINSFVSGLGQELTIQKQPNTSLKDNGPPSNSGGQTPQSSSNQKSPAR